MDNNLDILYFNSFLYLVAFLVSFRKTASEKAGGFYTLWSPHRVTFGLYFFVSIVAIFLYINPISPFDFDLKYFPFIFLWFFLVIFASLLKRVVKTKRGVDIQEKEYDFLYFCGWLTAAIIIANSTISLSSIGLSDLFSSEGIINNYIHSQETLSESYSTGTNYLNLANYVVTDLAVFLLAISLFRQKKWLFTLLFIAIILNNLVALSRGARSYLTTQVISFYFFYFLFSPLLSEKTKKVAKVGGSILLAFVCSLFVLITLSRFSDKESVQNQMLSYKTQSYTSQSMLVFNEYAFNANGIRYGDRTVPLVRKSLGLKVSTNYYERRDQFHSMLVDDSYFITFVGEFMLDFGPGGAIVILLLLWLFFFAILRKNKHWTVAHLLSMFIIFQLCTYGVTLFPFAEKAGNLRLLLYAFVGITCFVIRQSQKRRYRSACV